MSIELSILGVIIVGLFLYTHEKFSEVLTHIHRLQKPDLSPHDTPLMKEYLAPLFFMPLKYKAAELVRIGKKVDEEFQMSLRS
jgi:hypothetical protein